MGLNERCERTEQMGAWFSLALDGRLALELRQKMDAHLAECPDCQAQWDVQQRLSDWLERAPEAGPPFGFALRVERRLAERTHKERRLAGGMALLTGSLSLVGAAAAAVVVIALGWLVWQWMGPQPSADQGGAVLQVASGLGLVGKGASLFLKEVLTRWGPPVFLALGIGLLLFGGLWAWLYRQQAGRTHRNGYA